MTIADEKLHVVVIGGVVGAEARGLDDGEGRLQGHALLLSTGLPHPTSSRRRSHGARNRRKQWQGYGRPAIDSAEYQLGPREWVHAPCDVC